MRINFTAFVVSDSSIRGKRLGQHIIVVRDVTKGEMLFEFVTGLNIIKANEYMKDKLYKLMKKDEENYGSN